MDFMKLHEKAAMCIFVLDNVEVCVLVHMSVLLRLVLKYSGNVVS